MENISKELNNLNLNDLHIVLKDLKLYRGLKKQLWDRGKTLYKQIKTWEKIFEVEYFTSMSEDLAWEEAKKAFKKAFDLEVERNKVKFTPKQSLIWWIRVYVDDKVVDLSYSKIEKTLKK